MDHVPIEGVIVGVLQAALSKYPWLMVFITILGVFRAVFKPLMLVFEKLAGATPTLVDDQMLNSFKASKWYKGMSWFVDYAMSIKLPQLPPVDDQKPK